LRKVVLKKYIILVLTYKYSKLLDGLFKISLNFVLNVMKKMAGKKMTTVMVKTSAFVIKQTVIVGVMMTKCLIITVLQIKLTSDSIKIGVSVMMNATIEVIYGRLMTIIVVVLHMLSMICGLTNVMKKKKIIIIMILAVICTQEKVKIQKNNAIICQVVNINLILIQEKNGVTGKNLMLILLIHVTISGVEKVQTMRTNVGICQDVTLISILSGVTLNILMNIMILAMTILLEMVKHLRNNAII